MTSVAKLLKLRECSNVRRCHTTPHIGDYTVGKHSFDATMLLLTLHPNPSMRLVRAMMLHDCAERWVGDMPGPAKWFVEGLGERYEAAESKVAHYHDIAPPTLNTEEAQWLLGCDRLELWMWSVEQLNGFGNRHVVNFITTLDDWFIKNKAMIPVPILEAHRDLSATTWKRQSETVK